MQAVLTIGLKYYFNADVKKQITLKQKGEYKKYGFSVTPAFSVAQTFPALSRRFYIFDIMIDGSRQINPAHAIGAGLDLQTKTQQVKSAAFTSQYEHVLAGIKLFYNFNLGNLD